MKPLAGAEVSDFGTRFGFEAAGSKNSEPEALAESTEKSASASGSSPQPDAMVVSAAQP